MLAQKINELHQGIFGEISLIKAIVGDDSDDALSNVVRDYNEGFYKLKEFIHRVTDVEMSAEQKKEIFKRRTNSNKER